MSEPRSILVVDDQSEILDLAALALRGAGYDVTTIDRGTKAIESLARRSFDLVLLDINMPEMDGWETLDLIRTEPRWADLPVAMFSIKGAAHDKMQGMQGGATDYITKPFDVDELLARVARILDRTLSETS